MVEKASLIRALSNTSIAFFTIMSIIVSGFIISFLIYKATAHFTSLDQMPELLPLVPKALEQFGGNPSKVTVGLYIKDFTEFDITSNDFTFSGIIWFLFNPTLISLDTLSKFTVEKGQILDRAPPITSIEAGKLLARYDIRVKLKSNLTYALFPFDSHVIYIVVDNNYVSPGDLIMSSSHNDFVVSPEISTTGWKMLETSIYSGYSTSNLRRSETTNMIAHPRLIFGIAYAHSGIRQALTILLPLIFIFFMSLFTFSFEEKNYATSLTLSSGAVTAQVAYRFVIENLAPKVGYFMLSDYLFFLFLIGVVIVFFINVGFLFFRQRYPRSLIVGMQSFVIIGLIYLLRF